MSKLSPGERAINWAKALGILCTALTALLGYTNRDTLARWVNITPADGKTEIVGNSDKLTPFEQQVKNHTQEADARMTAIEASIKKLQAVSVRGDGGLESRIEVLEGWHGD